MMSDGVWADPGLAERMGRVGLDWAGWAAYLFALSLCSTDYGGLGSAVQCR